MSIHKRGKPLKEQLFSGRFVREILLAHQLPEHAEIGCSGKIDVLHVDRNTEDLGECIAKGTAPRSRSTQ